MNHAKGYVGGIIIIIALLGLGMAMYYSPKQKKEEIPKFTTEMIQNITELSLVEISESTVFKYKPQSTYDWWDGKEIIAHAVITAKMGYDSITILRVDSLHKTVLIDLGSPDWTSISLKMEYISSDEGIIGSLNESDYNACNQKGEELLKQQLKTREDECKLNSTRLALAYLQNLLFPTGYLVFVE